MGRVAKKPAKKPAKKKVVRKKRAQPIKKRPPDYTPDMVEEDNWNKLSPIEAAVLEEFVEDPIFVGLCADQEVTSEALKYAAETERSSLRDMMERGVRPPRRLVKQSERETVADLGRDDRGWDNLSNRGSILNWTNSNRERVLKQCCHLYYRDPIARNVIRILTYLTVGKGMRVTFEDEKDQERWDLIAENNDWERRYRDIIANTYLLGEWFQLRSPLVGNTCWDDTKKVDRPNRDKLVSKVSKMDADQITLNHLTPLEVLDIIMSRRNREIIKAYKLRDDTRQSIDAADKTGGGNEREGWPEAFWATDVTHFKIDDLGVGMRGRPVLEPVLRLISQYRLYILDRLMMIAIRTRIPLIRKMSNAPKKKQSAKTAMTTQKLPRPGTVAIVDKDEVWEYPGGVGDGASATLEGRSLLLQISAGVNLPEYIVTSDASNSNMASLLAASGPVKPMIDERRQSFAKQFADLAEECVGARPTITFPDVASDNRLQEVQALSIMRKDKIISARTYAERMGEDYDAELERMHQELDDQIELDMLNPGDDSEGWSEPTQPAAAGTLDDEEEEEE